MGQDQVVAPKKRSFNFEDFVKDVGLFLLQILAPVAVTGGVLYWLAGAINFWTMERSLAVSVFALLFVLLSLVLTVLLGDVVNRFRKKKSPRVRLVTMVIGGLIIPVGIFTAANLLMIAPGETYMARMITVSLNQNVDVSIQQLGSAIANSNDPYTKIQGIKAIQAIHSSQGLEQLFQILNKDNTATVSWQVANELSKAIASYGAEAKPGLISAFQAHLQTTTGTNVPTDLYNRYFAQSFASLKNEINSQPLDSQTRQSQLQQINGLASQVQTQLNNIQSESLLASGADPVLSFVLNTFLQMNISQDGDIYALARTTASDLNLPDDVRGEAILLIAKLGSNNDMTLLYQYLQNNSELIKADTLEAITNLTQKQNGPSPTQIP